jgi:hypothetical protein
MHYVGIVIYDTDLFSVQNCGLRKLVECVPQRKVDFSSQHIFMPRSIVANRLYDTGRDTHDELCSSMWLGFTFTFHSTGFSAQ